MLRNVVLILSLMLFTFLYAEKYAIIYTELQENSSSKVMESAWKTTFLKWEELYRKDNYKLEYIYVLYSDGIDYSCTIYGTSLDLRYSPHQYGIDYICYKKTPASKVNLDTLTETLKDKLKSKDELNIFKYDPDTNKLIESK